MLLLLAASKPKTAVPCDPTWSHQPLVQQLSHLSWAGAFAVVMLALIVVAGIAVFWRAIF